MIFVMEWPPYDASETLVINFTQPHWAIAVK